MAVRSYNPRTGSRVLEAEETSSEAVAQIAVDAAAAAGALATTRPSQRRAWLDAIAEAVVAHTDELVALSDTETGLGADRLRGELNRVADQLRFYGRVAEDGLYLGATIDNQSPTSPRLIRLNRPLGAVAVFGSSNFPFAFGVLGNDTASAIAAGCPVVVKAHNAHLGTCIRLFEIATGALAAAGAPPATLSIVFGRAAGVALVGHPNIKAVGFTGSEAGGMALWRAANARTEVIPVYAEMGTVNPAVLTPGGAQDAVAVAEGFADSFTRGFGQFCTKPGLLFAPTGHSVPALVARALEKLAPQPIMLTEGIAASVNAGIDELVSAGATVITRITGPADGWSADAAVLSAPAAAFTAGSRLREECFGAVALVVEYDNVADLPALLATLQPSLAASVFGGGAGDADIATIVAALAAQVGRVTVGDWPTGVVWTWAQHHGGPWPATSNSAATSVGAAALGRFVRPVTFQSVPPSDLPPAEREASSLENPWKIPQRIDGILRLP